MKRTTFMPDEQVMKEGHGEKWLLSERDYGLNSYFAGGNPELIGKKYKGAKNAFTNSIINKLKANYKGKAERYKPSPVRVSRIDLPFTKSERTFIAAHRALHLDPEITATICMRRLHELADPQAKAGLAVVGEFASAKDRYMACAFAEAVHQILVVDQATLEAMRLEEEEFGGVPKIEEMKKWPRRIRHLALYLKMLKEDESE